MSIHEKATARRPNPWQPNDGGGVENPLGEEESFLYRFEARLEVLPVGRVPEGIRMVNSFDGRATAGEFEGARVWGIDHFLLRSDGVGIVDAPKTISGDGFHLYEHVRAYSLPPEGLEMPPLEAVLDRDFEWPDIHFAIHGFSTFRTGSPELAYLNRRIARIDGWVEFTTGDLAVETSLVEHRREVGVPGRDRAAA